MATGSSAYNNGNDWKKGGYLECSTKIWEQSENQKDFRNKSLLSSWTLCDRQFLIGSAWNTGEYVAGRKRHGVGSGRLKGDFRKTGGDKLATGTKKNHKKKNSTWASYLMVRSHSSNFCSLICLRKSLFGLGFWESRNRRSRSSVSRIWMAVCQSRTDYPYWCNHWNFLNMEERINFEALKSRLHKYRL